MRPLAFLPLLAACADPALPPTAAVPPAARSTAPSASAPASASALVTAVVSAPSVTPAAPVLCQDEVNRRVQDPRLAESCGQGDAADCARLGLGRAALGDEDGAAAPLDKACQASEPGACRERALLRSAPPGGDAGRLALLDRACRGGDGEGCHVAAVRRWIRGDVGAARRGLGRGCELAFGASCGLLGWMHDAGEGGRRDVAQAREFYKKSGSEIDLGGCHRLSSHIAGGPRSGMSMCDRGIHGCAAGCGDDCARRAARLRRSLVEPLDEACQAGRRLACVVSATASSLGESVNLVGQVVAPDSERARAAFLAACQQGMFLACESAAIHITLDADERPGRLRQAADLRARGCTGGDGAACLELGKMIELGEGRVRDPHSALVLFETACSLGSLLTCHDLAVMYRDGDGVKADSARSAAFARAAEGQ